MDLDERVTKYSLEMDVRCLNRTLRDLPIFAECDEDELFYFGLWYNERNGKVALRKYWGRNKGDSLVIREIQRKAMHYVLIGMVYWQHIIKEEVEKIEADRKPGKREDSDEH